MECGKLTDKLRGYELNQISHQSKNQTFSLWYDEITEKYYMGDYIPETAHFIFDVEQEESPEFIAEVTNIVLRDIHDGMY